jgi:hypothetical protein
MIVIGLGTGRSGTASLAKLLNAQPGALCFHEMNPSCVRFFGTPRPILNTIDEFQAILDGGDTSMLTVDLSRRVSAMTYERLCSLPRLQLIGDIAFYYLGYVDAIAERNPNVRFICLRRNEDQTVESWMRKSMLTRWRSKRVADRVAAWITRQPFYESHNFWMEHDGKRWLKDPVWDKCFPKFEAVSKRDAIHSYWQYYYQAADELHRRFPERFRIVDTNALDDPATQREILKFCGVPAGELVLTDAHIHRSAPIRRERAEQWPRFRSS